MKRPKQQLLDVRLKKRIKNVYFDFIKRLKTVANLTQTQGNSVFVWVCFQLRIVVSICIEMEEIVTQCNIVAHSCVFNSFYTTMELYDTEE